MTQENKLVIKLSIFVLIISFIGGYRGSKFAESKPQTESEFCQQYSKSLGFEMFIPDCISSKGNIDASQVMVNIQVKTREVCLFGGNGEECVEHSLNETITLQQAFDLLNLKYTPPTETRTEAKLEFVK